MATITPAIGCLIAIWSSFVLSPRPLQSPCHVINGDELVGSHGPRVSLSSVLSHLWGCSISCSMIPSSPSGESGVRGGQSFSKTHFTESMITDAKCLAQCVCVCADSLQSCLALCDPMDCRPPGSSVHGILQARILEWVAIPSSRGSS